MARGWKLRSGPPPKAPRGAGALITCGRPEELERERAMNMLEQAEETAARLCGGLLTLAVAQCWAHFARMRRWWLVPAFSQLIGAFTVTGELPEPGFS